MRIATSELYSSSVATMENQQSQMLQLEQQVSSGVAISNPADDPLGAAQAVTLSATSATLTQYSSNQTSALSSLQTEDTTLTSVTTTMQSINSLIQQAMGGTLNDTDRAALSKELSGYRNELMSLANTTDGQGNSIFSGFQNTTQVFTNNPGGGVTYNGDAGQRTVQVTGTRNIPVSDTGASVFMSVQSLGSQPVPAGNPANTGNGTIGGVTITNQSAATNNDSYSISFTAGPASPANTGSGALGAVSVTNTTASTNNDNYTISFSNVAGVLNYTVTDTSDPSVAAVTAPYTSGAAIALGSGLSTSISGTPNAGDSFSASQAGGSMYATVTDTSANPPVAPVSTVYTDGANISLGTGMNVAISDAPAAGDSFTVTPATNSGNTDVFATLDSMIAALNNPAQDNATATATMQNALSTGLAQMSNSLDNVVTIHASVGGREQELQAVQTVTSTNALQVTTNLQTLTSVDLTKAISQYTQVQSSLSASQKVFAQTQSLSLFQYFNP
ncbi:flagellar hook-associated protein FlgL [Paraburkholderia dinghuensis]|uniref:Flagellar hook-associated protein 3 n=1 Tax=Paraburkholderia dinghuensis TaxID=2305225 RepID=A0A3N6NYQ0_9BURK|nr:flagellar hook-associated protein FlgL [Paraburkholderia dinghuensis]RQH06023.1 flagellar hook-associated protein 3 [Paraburkholderia dinghuensis]